MELNEIKADVILDVSNLMCPLPGVKAVKAARKLEQGKVLEVKSSNAIFKKFGPMITRKLGNDVLGMIDGSDGYYRLFVKKS